jgi:hypothetical protein
MQGLGGAAAMTAGAMTVTAQGMTSVPASAADASSALVTHALRLVMPVTTASGNWTGGTAVGDGDGAGLRVAVGVGMAIGVGDAWLHDVTPIASASSSP